MLPTIGQRNSHYLPCYVNKPFSKMLGAVGVTDELIIYGDLGLVPE